MLTAVQTLPQNRMMWIKTGTGVVTLVVWAHCLLGLPVIVTGTPFGTVEFGTPNGGVLIKMSDEDDEASLLDSSH